MSEQSNQSQQILFYTDPQGTVHLEVFFEDETLWLSQKQLAELFAVEVNTVNYHLKEIFKTQELSEDSVIRKIRITAADGKKYLTNVYHLDAIIAVGYRVNSWQATRFRQWATQTLREFIIKGFVMDDARLKQGQHWGKDYFDELLERIREIRASERRFYQKITDIYAQCSIDYDPKASVTQTFYAKVQNKLHWAIHGHTAAELIKERANSDKPNMGLTTWKNAPQGKILKGDAGVAKNYLTEDELRSLNRIVTMYLDFAELQAERQNAMRMDDWITKLDGFLQFNDYQLLNDAGSVSAALAKQFADVEFQKFRVAQDRHFESDFDKAVKQIKDKGRDK
ncbi:MAG: virulence RhuM family protein [Gammaproteobacteria bacterium]|nr:virulence RhuM family protein [Gammaproteobacteria bacterium]